MKTKLLNVKGNEFIEIEVSSVNQKGSRFYIAVIPAKNFLNIYTVEPATYDSETEAEIAKEFKGDEEYFEYRSHVRTRKTKGEGFERRQDKTRISDIAKFLNKEQYPLFPNSIIATCYLINDEIDISIGTTIEELVSKGYTNLSYLREDDEKSDTVNLYIPNKPNSVLVIDGQHRLKGLQEAGEGIWSNYSIIVSFMLGFPRAVIAELFYTINYNQKPVNKSLLYDLMGEFSHELNEITFIHEIVRVLNEVEKSPFFRRIKMLGVAEKDATSEIRAKMTISQAFLIDYLVNTISKDALRSSIYPPIFLYYYQNVDYHNYIIRFILNYFQAVSRIKHNDWNNPETSIICNSIGIGALIRVMHFIFLKMFISEFRKNPLEIQRIGVDQLTQKLNGIDRVDFSKEHWAGSSSGGALNKLMKDIMSKVKYLNAEDYQAFVVNYKNDYVEPFKKWIGSVVHSNSSIL